MPNPPSCNWVPAKVPAYLMPNPPAAHWCQPRGPCLPHAESPPATGASQVVLRAYLMHESPSLPLGCQPRGPALPSAESPSLPLVPAKGPAYLHPNPPPATGCQPRVLRYSCRIPSLPRWVPSHSAKPRGPASSCRHPPACHWCHQAVLAYLMRTSLHCGCQPRVPAFTHAVIPASTEVPAKGGPSLTSCRIPQPATGASQGSLPTHAELPQPEAQSQCPAKGSCLPHAESPSLPTGLPAKVRTYSLPNPPALPLRCQPKGSGLPHGRNPQPATAVPSPTACPTSWPNPPACTGCQPRVLTVPHPNPPGLPLGASQRSPYLIAESPACTSGDAQPRAPATSFESPRACHWVPAKGVLPTSCRIPQPPLGASQRSCPTSCRNPPACPWPGASQRVLACLPQLPNPPSLPLTGAAKVILAYLMPNPQTCTAAPRPSVHAYSAEYPSLPTGGAAKGPDLTSCRIPSLPLRSSQGSCPTSCPYSPSLPLSAAARGPAYLMPMPQPAPRVQPRGPAYLIANPPDLPTGASQRVLALLMHRTPQPATGVPAKAVPAPPHCRIPKALPLSSTKGSMPTVIA
ncbi:hypothetical protein C0Q70_04795 [Pomacea canaliculata]|uniref:Uncharacterized protein n=1 Tax=Pomacea canaliculata TaxID=400727 RepID=A0A2T7PJF0_POMCA|nr:hypothetical protein C0Q70_04795 [Pomacea canaliculata]